MSFEVETKTFKLLVYAKTITPADVKQTSTSTFEIKQSTATQFENGTKVSLLLIQIYKKRGLPIPATINHLKQSNGTAAQLYNWNILNDALKKIGFEIDSETKNLIINGDREHLAMVLRKLVALFESDEIDDSLQTEEFQRKYQPANNTNQQTMKDSLTLSRSEDPNQEDNRFKSKALTKNIDEMRKYEGKQIMARGDLIEFVLSELAENLKLSKKQAVALLSDNNKYFAHVVVKGVKGQFQAIQSLMQRFYSQIDYIVEKMAEQNDMCFYFLQIIKPTLLSKNEQIAQWGCRILTKIAHQLAIRQILPLAYDWFVQEAGGLSTTILALTRHPKLNEHVVGFILEFARFNVTELFTIQLKKITNNDNLAYVKFMLLIFNHLVSSKISAEQLLQSGAIDYWIQISLKGAQNDGTNSRELRMYCIQFLIKIWRAYPTHIEDTLDHVNNIMNQIKRGIRDQSQIMRFSLMQMMFDLLNQFASKKNSYASIVYKKITFLFIQNHEQLTMREFILRNLQQIFQKYSSIPVEIFLEPFIKQIKISESKSYVVNMFDMEFISVAVKHKKLKVNIGLELFDLLAKTKLNSYSFSEFATDSMEVLIDRFAAQEIFQQYIAKLVKISLAMFYSTLKQPKQFEDQERLQAQKRAQIVNLIISIIQRGHQGLNQEIKNLVVHVKVQIMNRLGIEHRGIQKILGYFTDVDEAILEAMQNTQDDMTSNATSTKSRGDFHLPKIESRNMMLRDDVSSQQSIRSTNTKYSQSSKQQFPIKDYTAFASEDEKKFLKQNGMGLKKRNMSKRTGHSNVSESYDPKIQEQILKIKQKKEQEERKKQRQKEQLEKKKQILKRKIQKELEQRNIMEGVRGNEKDVEVKVIFEENEINENILEEDQSAHANISEEQLRDSESIKIVLKKYAPFIKKIFNRYTNIRGGKKDYFEKDREGEMMDQIDLIRLCKEKNLEKHKNAIVELLRSVNAKNISNLSLDAFIKFLEALCIHVYVKQKCPPKMVMGDLMKKILRRMSQGENFKMDEDDDEACQIWSEKVRYNPQIDLPENFKKVTERVYKTNQNLSYTLKQGLKQSYADCYEILNEILGDCFKVNMIEEEVQFIEQNRVVHKKQYYLPPKPLKKEKEESKIQLLEEKQSAEQIKKRKPLNRSVAKQSDLQKQNNRSKSRGKVLNAAQKKRIEEQEEKQRKKQIQEQMRKQRALQVKRKLEKQQEQREREKKDKESQKNTQKQQEEQKTRRDKERKDKYLKDQKQKLEKHKKEQEEKQKQEKEKSLQQKQKDDEERKMRMKEQMKKDEEKRKEQYERMKKERQLSEQRKQKKREDDEKKKEQLKKQMMKKIEGQKEKLQIMKISKEIMHKIYNEPEVMQIRGSKYKEQFKAIFNYGREYNEFKLDKQNTNTIQQKGWLTLCQHLNFCDTSTANRILKNHIKEKNTNGISHDDLQQILFELAVKKQLENDLEDYDKAKKACTEKYDQFLRGLKLPKTHQQLKDYFVNLKNKMMTKKKEEISVVNPNGENQEWEIEDQ